MSSSRRPGAKWSTAAKLSGTVPSRPSKRTPGMATRDPAGRSPWISNSATLRPSGHPGDAAAASVAAAAALAQIRRNRGNRTSGGGGTVKGTRGEPRATTLSKICSGSSLGAPESRARASDACSCGTAASTLPTLLPATRQAQADQSKQSGSGRPGCQGKAQPPQLLSANGYASRPAMSAARAHKPNHDDDDGSSSNTTTTTSKAHDRARRML
mmetsp:Transcript_30197/g.76287  ORF Transcript_30197/g.76287 Transcript_30197/m.76287 type:complete len:213 (-) Transcript_30197:147-785(-)